MYKHQDAPYDVITSQLDLGEIYLGQNKFKEAITLGEEALAGSIEYETPDLKKSALTLLTRAYFKTGKPEKAHEAAMQIIEINENLFGLENARQINEMNAVYETEKKE